MRHKWSALPGGKSNALKLEFSPFAGVEQNLLLIFEATRGLRRENGIIDALVQSTEELVVYQRSRNG